MELKAIDRLILVRVKTKRAKQHLLEFDKLAKTFQGSYSEIVVTNDYPKGAQWAFSAAIPDIRRYPVASFELLAVAGDIVQNLRSALDHLVYQLAEVGSPGKTPGDGVGFPILDPNAKGYKTAKARKVKGVRPEAIKHIDSFEPYRGGKGDALWRLHQLSNIDKHRFIFTLDHDYLMMGDGFQGYYWLKTSNPVFDGLSHPKVNEKIDFLPGETLSEPKVPQGQPLRPFLHDIVGLVEDLVSSFERFLE